MPRPRYILCCEDRVVDRFTNRIVHFGVIDILSMHVSNSSEVHPPNVEHPLGTTAQKSIVTAVWMREEGDDPEAEFLYRSDITKPGEGRIEINSGLFKFSKRFYRIEFGVSFAGPLKPGILLIENSIRRADRSEDWLSQSFPIEILGGRDSESSDPA